MRTHDLSPLELCPPLSSPECHSVPPWICLLHCNSNCLKKACLLKLSVSSFLVDVCWPGQQDQSNWFLFLHEAVAAARMVPERSQFSKCFQWWGASGSLRWVVRIWTSYLLVEVQIGLYLGKMTASVLGVWRWGICPPDSGLREFAAQASVLEFKDVYWWVLSLFLGGHIFLQFKIFPNHWEIFPLE